jgi:hypothetical protein
MYSFYIFQLIVLVRYRREDKIKEIKDQEGGWIENVISEQLYARETIEKDT